MSKIDGSISDPRKSNSRDSMEVEIDPNIGFIALFERGFIV